MVVCLDGFTEKHMQRMEICIGQAEANLLDQLSEVNIRLIEKQNRQGHSGDP
jgi:hypothetical protein